MLFLPFLQEHFKKNIGHSHICLPLLFLLYSKKNCKGGFDMPYTVFISDLPSSGKIKADSATALFPSDRYGSESVGRRP